MRTSTLPRGRETAVIRLYAWAVVVATGLAVAAALLVTRTAPQYSASAEILVGPTITSSGNYIPPSMPTEQRVATSTDVISRASVQLDVTTERPLEHLEVSVPVDTQVLVMTYTADTPASALAGAQAFAQTYLDVRNPKKGDAIAALVSPPKLPSAPVTTNYPVVLGVAVLAGVLIGLGVARAWDRVRGRIRTVDDAERSTGLAALATTPRLARITVGGDQRALTGGPVLASLAARVLGQVEEGQRSSVLVTGAAPGCGTTAVATLTALALARMGRVVLLVTADADVVARLSRDRVPRAGTAAPPTDVWPNVRATTQDGLHVIAVAEWDQGGTAVARLTGLLPELHDHLPEALIVIDGPPAWSSAGLALRADKILLIAALGWCSRASAAAAVQALDHCAEKIMGLVVTPRPRLARRALLTARGWATLRAKGLMFRFGPLSGGLAPEPVTLSTLPSAVEPSRSVLS